MGGRIPQVDVHKLAHEHTLAAGPLLATAAKLATNSGVGPTLPSDKKEKGKEKEKSKKPTKKKVKKKDKKDKSKKKSKKGKKKEKKKESSSSSSSSEASKASDVAVLSLSSGE